MNIYCELRFFTASQLAAFAVPWIELLRRSTADEVEFVTLMWFESLDAVRAFARPDYEVAVVPAAARALLRRFDARSGHY